MAVPPLVVNPLTRSSTSTGTNDGSPLLTPTSPTLSPSSGASQSGSGLGCQHVSSTTSTNSRDSNTSSESGLISIIQQQGVMSASTPMFGVFRLSPDQSTQTNNGFSVFTQPLIVNKARLPLVQ